MAARLEETLAKDGSRGTKSPKIAAFLKSGEGPGNEVAGPQEFALPFLSHIFFASRTNDLPKDALIVISCFLIVPINVSY